MSWGGRGLWPRAAVRIEALDADCDRPAYAQHREQKRGGSTNVISCPSVSVAFSAHVEFTS